MSKIHTILALSSPGLFVSYAAPPRESTVLGSCLLVLLTLTFPIATEWTRVPRYTHAVAGEVSMAAICPRPSAAVVSALRGSVLVPRRKLPEGRQTTCPTGLPSLLRISEMKRVPAQQFAHLQENNCCCGHARKHPARQAGGAKKLNTEPEQSGHVVGN